MIATLIWVLILLIICGLLCYAVRMVPIDQPWKNVAVVVIIIIFVLVLLQLLGGIVPWPGGRLP